MNEYDTPLSNPYGEQPQQMYSSPTMFMPENSDNLIKYQLDNYEELQRIEHLLRKHVPYTDEQGNVLYRKPSEEEQLFNERGVNEILNLLAWYLNKNIILSNFKEEEIQLRCYQFAEYLADFIYNNYELFGLNTKDKIKHYPLIVMNIVNTVEASYNRALNGGERDSLRTARSVQQTQPLQQPMYPQMPQQKNRSMIKPWTW